MKRQGRIFKALLGAILLVVFALAGNAEAVGTWSLTGSMSTPRWLHTATLLPDGRVLVSGGHDGSSALASAELYDPALGTWSLTGSMSSPRTNFPTATLLPDGRVLVSGGHNGSSALASAELYDPALGTWSPTGSMNAPRWIHTATLLPDGRVLVSGGHNGSSALASAELYDPAAGTWSVTGSMSTPRYGYTATLLPNGRVLASGGYSSGYLASAELYDPALGTWSPTGSMSTPRYTHTATLLPNGRVLASAGECCGGVLASAELYDPAAGTWSLTGSMSTPRSLYTATLLADGQVLVNGGSRISIVLASAELYDPVLGTWSLTASMSASRFFHTTTLLPDGRGLISGGHSGSAALASAEVLTQNEPPTAEAGANQSIHVGQNVELNGGGSSDDNTPSENLLYAWSFSSAPAGSTAVLTGADTVTPSFIADMPGDYVISLVVTDEGALSSAPDEVTVSSLNTPPTANAGPDQGSYVGNTVVLDGSASSDADFDPLTYAWTLSSRPAGSHATLSGADSAMPTFLPDLAGTYVSQLVVNDGHVDSTPDEVNTAVITTEQFAEGQAMEALNVVSSLPPASVTTKGNQTALGNLLLQAIESLQASDPSRAIRKLEAAVERTDGCALRGSPDAGGGGGGDPPAKDYVANCTDQAVIYPGLMDALDALSP